MPADPRGWAERLQGGGVCLRYRDQDGVKHRARDNQNNVIRFPHKTAALAYFRDVIGPQLRAGAPVRRELTLAELVDVYLDRHAVAVRPRTIATLRERLAHAITAFGDERLADLEVMSDEIAGWRATLPPRAGHGIAQALRQVLDAGVRWGHITRNPAKLAGSNPTPPPRAIRVYTRAELDEIAANLSPAYRPLPSFAAATGLRPEEWQALERQDVDRRAGVLHVRRTVSSGELVELAKTSASRRQVPLTPRALAALDELPARLSTPLLFPAPADGLLNLNNWRRREWAPAIDAGAILRPARIYDLRSTFASNAIAAGIDVFELARVMGTSVRMIERHYGTLLTGAAAGIAARLAAFEAAEDDADRASDSDG